MREHSTHTDKSRNALGQNWGPLLLKFIFQLNKITHRHLEKTLWSHIESLLLHCLTSIHGCGFVLIAHSGLLCWLFERRKGDPYLRSLFKEKSLYFSGHHICLKDLPHPGSHHIPRHGEDAVSFPTESGLEEGKEWIGTWSDSKVSGIWEGRIDDLGWLYWRK